MLHLMGSQMSDMRPLSEHFYEQPMVVFQPGSTSADRGRRIKMSEADLSERTPFIEANGAKAGEQLIFCFAF